MEYYQLALNERHPETKVSTPRVIHSFGRADFLHRDELVRLCHSIAKACGLVIHDPFEDDKESPFDKGLPKDITLIATVVIIEALWFRLGIGQVFKEMAKSNGYKESYERALLAMTANRLCDPDSKLGVWERWLSKVFLPSCKDLKLADMYEAMDCFISAAARLSKEFSLRRPICSIWMWMSCFMTRPPRRLRLMKRMPMTLKRRKKVCENLVIPRKGVGKCKWSSPWPYSAR